MFACSCWTSGGELLLEARLLILELAQLRLELGLLARALGVLDLRLDLPLLRLVLRQPPDDRRELLGHLRPLADDLLRLGARRDDLLVQGDLVGLELVGRRLELSLLLRVRLRRTFEARLFGLERALLLLESLLLLLERGLLARERVGLLRQALLLALPLLLLLLELLLQALGLLLLARVLAARLGRGSEADRHDEGAVVAGAEAGGHQVVRLPLGGRLRRGADVFLSEVEGEERDAQRDQERERAGDCPPGCASSPTRAQPPQKPPVDRPSGSGAEERR